ncbi:MAG: hypothetical protein OXC41_06205 [Gammaproteobacteria bacterium]|nr:hypothetical protein [Gammaproteobacteria bacterium]
MRPIFSDQKVGIHTAASSCPHLTGLEYISGYARHAAGFPVVLPNKEMRHP